MGLGRAYSVGLVGLQGHVIEVESDIGSTLPSLQILGLPDASLQEARERVKAAAQNSGVPLSKRKITVNLLPASLPKRGSVFDLAIVIATLRAAGQIEDPRDTVFLAELGLDGRLRPVQGVLPAVMAAVRSGCSRIIVAEANRAEAELVPQAHVQAFSCLGDVVLALGADPANVVAGLPAFIPEEKRAEESRHSSIDLSEVMGQEEARLALEVAAAGGHHMLLIGPPGSGKTMLAERLPGILPRLDDEAAMDVTAIHSLSGVQFRHDALIRQPPFENPHHTASVASVIGGGSGIPRPGAASRAHRGVLFLDEAPEYDRRVLDGLRQPLENGELVLHRAGGVAAYPARFQLILAANPCPCGDSSVQARACDCSPMARRRYLRRLSGPLLDRIDIQLTVNRISAAQFSTDQRGESSQQVAERVAKARARAENRLHGLSCTRNADVPGKILRGCLRLPESETKIIDRALMKGSLTARGYDRVLRIAWTMADLEGVQRPTLHHIGQALSIRQHGASQ